MLKCCIPLQVKQHREKPIWPINEHENIRMKMFISSLHIMRKMVTAMATTWNCQSSLIVRFISYKKWVHGTKCILPVKVHLRLTWLLLAVFGIKWNPFRVFLPEICETLICTRMYSMIGSPWQQGKPGFLKFWKNIRKNSLHVFCGSRASSRRIYLFNGEE